MDPANYYATTLMNAAKNIGPIILFLVGGYIFFIKLPFLLMVKVSKENKPKIDEENKNPKVAQKTAQDASIKLDSMSHQERMRQKAQEIDDAIKKKEREREEERQRQERKRAEREKTKTEEKNQQKKTESKREEVKKDIPPLTPAAQLFDFKPGESFSQGELKKRYYELLRQNHPDKVASLGKEFKELAEKKTKEINSAYDELKKKAS
jgi:DnaJ-domain-containing protein 1